MTGNIFLLSLNASANMRLTFWSCFGTFGMTYRHNASKFKWVLKLNNRRLGNRNFEQITPKYTSLF